MRGILINNPSNPTGAVFSREHLIRIVALAGKYRVPIIADEIYGDLAFGNRRFHPLADVAASMGCEVPIVTASGLGKQCECHIPPRRFFFAAALFVCHPLSVRLRNASAINHVNCAASISPMLPI